MACGKIRIENAHKIIEETGVDQIHLRCTTAIKDKYNLADNTDIKFNGKAASENSYNLVDEETLDALNVGLNSKWM